MVMQTTGLFESGDALRNVLFDLKLPIYSLIGVRNWLTAGSKDTARQFTEPILQAWGLDVLMDSTAGRQAEAGGPLPALSYGGHSRHGALGGGIAMTPATAVPVVAYCRCWPICAATDEIVVTNQGSARIWPKLRSRPLDFHYNPSTMGGAIPLGLGLALAQPSAKSWSSRAMARY